MKKLYLSLLSMGFASFALAQHSVTFQVNMKNQTVGPNGVHVAGSFQAAAGFASDWDPSTAELLDPDNDDVYTLTVTLPDGTYEYKFVNGNAWGSDEGVPSTCAVNNNRQLIVAGAAVSTPDVCFASCNPCPNAVDTVNFTFKVDMSLETVGANGVHIAGDVQTWAGHSNWDPSATALTNTTGNIWEVTIPLPEGTYSYKFVNGNAWGQDETAIPTACNVGGNREIVIIGNGDNVNDNNLTGSRLVAFNLCPPVDTVAVTFSVDMSNSTVSPNGIHLAGSLQSEAGFPGDWDPATTALSNGGAGDIYSITLNLPEGTYAYKFVNGNAWGSDESVPSGCAVDNNRRIIVAGNGDAFTDNNATATEAYCFAKCVSTCPIPLPPVNVTFRLDLSNEIPSGDGVFLAGGFTAWDKDSLEMVDADGNGLYAYTVNLVPDEYQYKYYNGFAVGGYDGESYDFENGGCGLPNGVGGFNRVLDISTLTNDTTLTTYVYNSCDFSTLSVSEVVNAADVFKIFPNPVVGSSTILFADAAATYAVAITDITGKVIVNRNQVSNGYLNISAAAFNAGIYFVSVTDKAGVRTTQKIVVQ